jgi:hypothetical protein
LVYCVNKNLATLLPIAKTNRSAGIGAADTKITISAHQSINYHSPGIDRHLVLLVERVEHRVARWFIFKPKITIWVNSEGL